MTVVKGSIHRNREGKSFEVIRIKSENDVMVRFIETGYSCRVRSKLLLDGNVRDYTYLETERESWEPHTELFKLNSGYEAEALSKKGKLVRIRFIETGTVVVVDINNVRAGRAKDPLAITCYDRGYLGFADRSLPYHKQAFQLWRNMMKRCYSECDERGYFGKATVDERWFGFENFLNDIKHLEGFADWVKGSTDSYKASNLDKDFYVTGNTVYSRNYCRFLPQAYNKSLGKKNKTEKDWA